MRLGTGFLTGIEGKMNMAELDDLKSEVEILRWVQAQREKLEEELKELQEREKDALAAVKDAMGETDTTGTIDGKPVVDWPFGHTTQLDQKRLGKELPNVSKAYKHRVEFRKALKVL